jgi:hypothetical protein
MNDFQQTRGRKTGDYIPLAVHEVRPLVNLTKPQRAAFDRLVASRPGFFSSADLGQLTIAAVAEVRMMEALTADPPVLPIALQRLARVYGDAIRELRLTPRSRAANDAKVPAAENAAEEIARSEPGKISFSSPWDQTTN